MDSLAPLPGVPPEHIESAREVCAHLVMLRGGAIFLSSADALRLVGWLDEHVEVSAILGSLERAAEARRKSRSRLPLTLGRAARHLNRPTRPGWRSPPETERSGPLAPLVAHLEALALTDPQGARLRGLASALETLEVGDTTEAFRRVMEQFRLFFQDVDGSLGGAERTTLRAQAHRELGDLLDGQDSAASEILVAETVRDLIRQRYAVLSAGTVWDLLAEDR